METNRLVQTWVTVVDGEGRSHLEARWVVQPAVAPAPQPAHAA